MSGLAQFRPQAVIFDVDGTLVDNMAWHAMAFDAFVARHGLPPMTLETRRRTDGKRNREIFPLLFGRDLTELELRAFENEKEGDYRQLSRRGLEPMPGLLDLLGALERHGIAAAVATSAPADNVSHTLGEIGLSDRFAAIARGDQVARGKPAPDVFLHAAALLRVDPARCLAFEDAPLGIASARSAGMFCVAMTTTFAADELNAVTPPPHAAYADFSGFLQDAGAWLTQE